MSDLSPSASQLAAAFNDLKRRLMAFGYEEISYSNILIKVDEDNSFSIEAVVFLRDEFQDPHDWKNRVQCGEIKFGWNETFSRFHIPLGFLSREQRELSVIANQTGQHKEHFSRMTSAFAQEYVRRLTEDLERFQQITHQPS